MRAIRCARVFDGQGFTPGPATVVLDGGMVVGVEDGHPDIGSDCRIVDATDLTALPGLIDTHVHLVCDSRPGALDRAAGDGDLEPVIGESLRHHLAAGVTTVRDLGDRDYAVLRHRSRSGPGRAPEPAVIASGPPITVPAGHCHFLGGAVDGPATITRAIREHADRGADLIKVMASGGMSTPGTATVQTQFTDGDLAHIVREAHAAGLPVTAHAHWLTAIEQAVAAGVDGIEHCSCFRGTGTELPESLLATLAERQVAVSGVIPPTTNLDLAPPAVREHLAATGQTPELVRAWRAQMIRRLVDAGVPVATGLDAGLNPWLAHGHLREAIDLFAEGGLSAAQVLTAATSTAATICGVGDRKGRLRPGHDADLVLVDGDPNDDVGAAVRAVAAVYLAGDPVAGIVAS
ncbi:amidohydrolase family protein [Nakamurella sp.]|uniref:amidohydrolase family protein n=1 Tax=Nakamurella sp. TaxID=1869182 RepID=UPI003783248A